LVQGLEPDQEQLDFYLHRSLMLVTALSPVIGYDKAARIAHLARDRKLTLREAAVCPLLYVRSL
jgi:fumarate hydratase class II